MLRLRFLAVCKASKQARREKLREALNGSIFILKKLVSPELPPDVVAEIDDLTTHMIARLQDATLERVAVAKLEGQTNREIAELIGVSIPTVERKLRLIRRIWTEEGFA